MLASLWSPVNRQPTTWLGILNLLARLFWEPDINLDARTGGVLQFLHAFGIRLALSKQARTPQLDSASKPTPRSGTGAFAASNRAQMVPTTVHFKCRYAGGPSAIPSEIGTAADLHTIYWSKNPSFGVIRDGHLAGRQVLASIMMSIEGTVTTGQKSFDHTQKTPDGHRQDILDSKAHVSFNHMNHCARKC